MPEIKIIYEDENFLAINKPAGLLVHAVRHNPNKFKVKSSLRRHESGLEHESITLVDWLIQKYPEIKNVGDDPSVRPCIVHRLDKDTSGIMLIPKTQAYFEYLKSLFQEHKIKKQYLAIVWGKVKEKIGVIDKPIGIVSGSLRRSVHSKKMQKEAITEYMVKRELVIAGREATLLEVYPKTGRTHQIRVHLSAIGHPIVGDKLYGKNKPMITPRQLLHAESIEFAPCPGESLKLSVEPPEDFTINL